MFSYADVANFIRQPEFADAIEEAWKEAAEEHEAIKEQKGFIELLKQAVMSERIPSINQKHRHAIQEINLTPEAFFQVLFTCAMTPKVFEAMRSIHENEQKPRPHGFGDGCHNDPHCEDCLMVHEPTRGVA